MDSHRIEGSKDYLNGRRLSPWSYREAATAFPTLRPPM